MDRKVLSQGLHTCTMKALSLLVQKLLPRLSFFQKYAKSHGQGHKVKLFGVDRKVLPQGIHTCNMKALSPLVQKLLPRLSFFSKVGQKSRSRSQGQTFWYGQKGLATRNTYL